MTFLFSALAQILHIALVLAAAPTALGLTRVFTARFAGRDGPVLLQPWHDLLRLSRKQVVLDQSASCASEWAPIAAFSVTLVCAAMVPTFTLGMSSAGIADLLTIATLLVLARLVTALAAMDAGTAQGGVATTRRTRLSVYAEPALYLMIFALAVLAGSGNLDLVAGLQREGMLQPGAASALAATALVAIALADIADTQSRVDQQQGGMALALMIAADGLRLLVWLNLVGTLFLPIGLALPDQGPLAWLVGLTLWLGKSVLFLAGIAAVRAAMGDATVRRLADLMQLAILLGFMAAVLALISAIAS